MIGSTNPDVKWIEKDPYVVSTALSEVAHLPKAVTESEKIFLRGSVD